MRPKEDDVMDKTLSEAVLLESGIKEVLFMEAHEQIGIRRGIVCAHGSEIIGDLIILMYFVCSLKRKY